MKKHSIIAIDGFSATGKSTIAKKLAQKLSYLHIDSGAMYRAITYFALKHCSQNGVINYDCLISQLPTINLTFNKNIETGVNEIYLNGQNIEKEIRSVEITQLVSEIAQNKNVREFLISEQRKLAQSTSVVMDGRDIGSVVFPNADYKFFITSSPEIRAERRLKDFDEKNINITFEQVLHDLKKRDDKDINREYSPLIQTKDAFLIDNSFLNQEETLNEILSYLNK